MRRRALLVVGVFAAAACGRSLYYPDPAERCVFDKDCAAGLRCVNRTCQVLQFDDGGRQSWLHRFAESCDGGAACESALCVGGPQGNFCSQACDGGCPSGYGCKAIPGVGNACAVPEPQLCQTCANDLECGTSGADTCVATGDDKFCGRDCTFEPCPALYACQTLAPGVRQCVPQGKTCDCTTETLGLQKSCARKNDAGVCLGAQVCQADGGFSACTARTATREVCNGLDDDCSGRIDDLPPTVCTVVNDAGICPGGLFCADGGVACSAPTPELETCNFKDDNCDGRVDEPFRDDAGHYVPREHCGGCGNDCDRLLAHATATACVVASNLAGCRATACEPGYFVQDGGTCAQLADSLCQSCVAASDCLGPASACLTLPGEKFCGRDCGPGSQFPACPTGYSCAPVDGGAQCVPSSGSCLCTGPRIGTVRGCTLSTCRGYQQCQASAGGPAWSSCDVASFNPEICDGIDDNCDGQVDEGFRNPVNGRYDSAQSCGFCNNDCTRIWSPSLQHTSGVCDDTGASPLCRMGPCSTEVVGGVTYEWVDVNTEETDGCECRRVQGAALTDLPDRLPGATPQTSYVDENCDGIDGVVGDALFVWEKAAPLGDGSWARPLQSIRGALTALPASGKKYVLVAEGNYLESVDLFEGAQLFGGYAPGFRARNPQVYKSVIVGQRPAFDLNFAFAAVAAVGVGFASPQTVVAGFTLKGFEHAISPNFSKEGEPSFAVYLRDCGNSLVLSDNDLFAGRGSEGGPGRPGTQGNGRQSTLALDGRAGDNSGRLNSGACPASFHRDGGTAGTNAGCSGASAFPGGGVVCPYVEFDAGTPFGNEQDYLADAGGNNGPGGFDWSFHPLGGAACFRASTHGADHDGRDGVAGVDGLSGPGGTGAQSVARHGSVVAGVWVPSPLRASPGGPGANAAAGGGGGAGGGTVRAPGAACTAWEWGATGGGGGAGACGGNGGVNGQGGGASIVVFAASAIPVTAAQSPRLVGNRLTRGPGGPGGNGGFGGAGGLGGHGGNGGIATTWSGSTAGKGGEGGTGGVGGGGGGGAGGPSFAFFGFNVDVAAWVPQNQLLTPATADTSGQGGVGGSAAGVGSTGGAGVGGAFGDVISLQGCAPSCPAGQTCDAYGVCVPL